MLCTNNPINHVIRVPCIIRALSQTFALSVPLSPHTPTPVPRNNNALSKSLSVFERIVKALSRITDKIIGFCRVLVHLILSSPVTQVQITQLFLPTWVDRATIGAGLGCVVERSVILCPPSLHRLHNTLHHLGLPLLRRNV